MARVLSTTELVSDVRSLLDEQNQSMLDDNTDIIPALNRAQDFAADILARNYDEPLLAKVEIPLLSNTAEYDMPADVFEERLQKVEVDINGIFYEVKRLSYRDISMYETRSPTNIPYYYVLIQKKIRLIPRPTSAYPLRLWYIKEPDSLVQPQGRVTLVNPTSRYVIVDDVGPDLTTNSDDYNSYVNIVNGMTGDIKASLQIQSIEDTRITFKTVPTRTLVLGKTVSSGTDLDTLNLQPDDYVCSIQGTCIPFMKKPLSNFLIQYAVAELTRKLGGAGGDLEKKILEDFEEQIKRTWAGREHQLRVKKASKHWDLPIRRYYTNS